jgi:HD-GYP domain-containing protein (c-di-GMP phosphodiesterase class II)
MGVETQKYRTVSTSVLTVGATLGAPIYDQNNTKLLGAGVVITSELLERLRERSIHSVVISLRDMARLFAYQPQGTANQAPDSRQGTPCKLASSTSNALDLRIDSGHALQMPAGADAFKRKVKRRGAEPYSQETLNRFSRHHEQAINELKEITDTLLRKQAADLQKLRTISTQSLAHAAEDIDLFACLGANPYFSEFPSRHSVHVASVAIAMAIEMELPERPIIDLAIGCLIHDLGMLALPQAPHEQQRELSDEEFVEIAKHPVLTVEMFANYLASLPFPSLLVAYQMHERPNGSGYPRGRTSDEIHALAKIAAVADAYTALVSPRPHRPGLQPYHAVRFLLKNVSEGLYDPAVVRALLRTISLFPLGSFVALQDDLVGKVIRSNPDKYDRPVVEIWQRTDLKAKPRILDLSRSEVQIQRTLAQLPQS